jgi:oligopeptide/dipeptide ABC transporter ATP-binding protein
MPNKEPSSSKTLLQVNDLKTHFKIGGQPLLGRPPQIVHAVDGVSFSIKKGEVLGLVGESGCGKSTVGRTLTRLNAATSGDVSYDGEQILKISDRAFLPFRRHIQMIFQDPYASLNPRMSIGETLSEPLEIHNLTRSKAKAQDIIAGILEKVGLSPVVADRYPHEFSGGQRQRIGIARAMILNPALVIADEPVSALDVSVQAQVLNLMKDIQIETGVAMLFISHDLGVVRHISDRVAVMYLGKIVEYGPKDAIFERPSHPYTQLLLQSIPRPDPNHTRKRPEVTGEQPSPLALPQGCRFQSRCPSATDVCRSIEPQITELSPGHSSACHLTNTPSGTNN